jgi:hypothetical protein
VLLLLLLLLLLLRISSSEEKDLRITKLPAGVSSILVEPGPNPTNDNSAVWVNYQVRGQCGALTGRARVSVFAVQVHGMIFGNAARTPPHQRQLNCMGVIPGEG